MNAPTRLLRKFLMRQLDESAAAWFETQCETIPKDGERALDLAVAAAPRKIGRARLRIGPEDEAEIEAACRGWRPSALTLDQAARLLFVTAPIPGVAFMDQLKRISTKADLGELIALYRGLPIYPDSDLLLMWAIDGVRTGMQPVFEAVAHENPYPAERFPEPAWNQMVLKALFIGSALGPIEGLDRRSNPELSHMMCDYAHERWAAGRPISTELWRCVGRFADESAIADLAFLLRNGSDEERQAAALALVDARRPESSAVLSEAPELQTAIDSGAITWSKLHGAPGARSAS